MPTFFVRAVVLALFTLCASRELFAAEVVEVQFTPADGDATAAHLGVYRSDDSRGFRHIGDTDGNGRIEVEVSHLQKPGKQGWFYRLTPHDPNRWTLSKATNRALPDVLAFYEDRRLAEAVSQFVETEWTEINGQLVMASKPLPRRGTIRMRAQDADGAPIRNHDVQLFGRTRNFAFNDGETVVWWGQTNAEGEIVLDQFAGLYDWIVCFPGLGHTQSGLVVLDDSGDPEVSLPRLVPYATIYGTIDKALVKGMRADERVCLESEYAWRYREAAIDSQGTFIIEDVPRGEYQARLKHQDTERSRISFVDPGEKRRDIAIRPKENAEPQIAQGFGSKLNLEGTYLVEGKVVDSAGAPVAEASAFATVGFHGIRSWFVSDQAFTNQFGKYQFEKVSLGSGSLAILVHVPGRPLAFAQFQFHRRGEEDRELVLVGPDGTETTMTSDGDARPAVLKLPDVIMPSDKQGGALRVRAIRDGRPVADAYIKLETMDFYTYFGAFGGFGKLAPDLAAALAPLQKTDAEGIAIFENLMPGIYRARATIEPEHKLKYQALMTVDQIEHLAVAPGGSRSIDMNVVDSNREPWSTALSCEVFHADGTHVRNTTVGTRWRFPGKSGVTHSGTDLSSVGLGKFQSLKKGICELEVRYLSPSLGSAGMNSNSGSAYVGKRRVAVSRLNSRKAPVIFNTSLVRPATATISAVVLDEEGNPVPAVVELDGGKHHRSMLRETYSASTDASGHVTFDRVPPGEHRVSAIVAGWSTAVASLTASDADLEGQFAVPDEFVDVSAGETATIRLRRQPVAFIRGKVVPPPADQRWAHVQLWDNWPKRPLPSYGELSGETGDYVIGPVLPGKHGVVIDSTGDDGVSRTARHPLSIPTAGVHHLDIPYRPSNVRSPWDKFSQARGTVLAPDGSSPVYAARIAGCFVGTDEPYTGTWSDAQGTFSLRDRNLGVSGLNPLKYDSDLRPPQAVVVAWLPGTLGASIVPLPEPPADGALEELKITLPHPAALEGTVTVAGKSTEQLPVVITLSAHFRGPGAIGEMQDAKTSANVDGQYRLDGLTPGEYEVQACLDGIWMSVSKSVVVPATGPSIQTLDFDFPELGDTAQYRLVDESGNPLTLATIQLNNPEFEGPAGKILRSIETDANGVLWVEGVSAGTHRAETADGRSFEFDVPPLGAPMLAPVDLLIGTRNG